MTTARGFVRGALQTLGVLPGGEEPTAEEYADGVEVLRQMLASWHDDGLYPATRVVTLTFAANVASQPIAGVVMAVGAPIRLLNEYSRDEWDALYPASGGPFGYYVDRQGDEAALHLWPVPTQPIVIKARVAEPVAIVDDADLAVPSSWDEAIRLNLAVRLAPLFGADAGAIEARAIDRERKLFDRSRPDFYRFEPDLSAYA